MAAISVLVFPKPVISTKNGVNVNLFGVEIGGRFCSPSSTDINVSVGRMAVTHTNLAMRYNSVSFTDTANLTVDCPWSLVEFRSYYRFHSIRANRDADGRLRHKVSPATGTAAVGGRPGATP